MSIFGGDTLKQDYNPEDAKKNYKDQMFIGDDGKSILDKFGNKHGELDAMGNPVWTTEPGQMGQKDVASGGDPEGAGLKKIGDHLQTKRKKYSEMEMPVGRKPDLTE